MTLIDARGHRCPVPTLRLQKALAGVRVGEVVRLLADDPMVRIDAPHFCIQAGHDLVSVEDADGYLIITVKKGA